MPIVAAVAALVGSVMSYMSARVQAKVATKQVGVEEAQLKQEKLENAQQFALQQALLYKQPADQQRQEQIMGLAAIGGTALLISGIFIFSAVKGKKAN